MSKARILFISPQPFFQWRGSPIRVKYNLQALCQLGYEVDLVTLPFGEDVEIEGLKIHRVSPIPGVRQLPIGPSFPKLLFNVKVMAKVRALVQERDYALIHAVEESAFFNSGLAGKKGIPFVYEKHSDPASYRKGGLRNLIMDGYSRMERVSMKRASAVIATGAGLADAVKAQVPETPCRHIFDIPSSMEDPSEEQVAQQAKALRQQEQEVLATYVGSFAVYQGIDLLFSAIPSACKQAAALRVIIVGGSDSEIAERKAQLAQAGVEDRVTFLGKMPPEKLSAVLTASDILLSPRVSGHNTPLKVLDYFKAGRSIAATDTEANRLILDEATAKFAAPEAAAFADMLATLAQDAGEREHLARAGRQLIEDTYNFKVYRDSIGELYSQVLAPSE